MSCVVPSVVPNSGVPSPSASSSSELIIVSQSKSLATIVEFGLESSQSKRVVPSVPNSGVPSHLHHHRHLS